MPDLDLRAASAAHAPAVFGCGVVALAAALGLIGARLLPTVSATPPLRFAQAPRRADGGGLQALQVVVRPGETLVSAVMRTGVGVDEARLATSLLSRVIDVAHVRAGLALHAAVTRPAGPGPARLVDLSLHMRATGAVAVARTPQGALALTIATPPVQPADTAVVQGVIHGSLYESAVAAGATPALVSQASALFTKTLDFARDLNDGDSFRLVFDRRADAAGRTVEAGRLLYAEVRVRGTARRFYRFAHDGRVEYVDTAGAPPRPLLLKTPLDGAHVTSSFGVRLHPILGYTRMHPGIDFGAPVGTPVYAAGDGVVEEVRWAGGYGHWLKLAHASGWETGYGHLSAYAAGVAPGMWVEQGQVVAYVGSTGLSTGPHLHYEIEHDGVKLDPATAAPPAVSAISRGEAAAFAAERARIDALLARGPTESAAAAAPAAPRLRG